MSCCILLLFVQFVIKINTGLCFYFLKRSKETINSKDDNIVTQNCANNNKNVRHHQLTQKEIKLSYLKRYYLLSACLVLESLTDCTVPKFVLLDIQ